MLAEAAPPLRRPTWQRALWFAAGGLCFAAGIVGIFVPLMPTTPFILIAVACFSRSSERCERWLLQHPRFGPLIHDWRTTHAMPLRAKQVAWASMAISSTLAWWTLPPRWCWLPAVCCAATALWIWRLPTRLPP